MIKNYQYCNCYLNDTAARGRAITRYLIGCFSPSSRFRCYGVNHCFVRSCGAPVSCWRSERDHCEESAWRSLAVAVNLQRGGDSAQVRSVGSACAQQAKAGRDRALAGSVQHREELTEVVARRVAAGNAAAVALTAAASSHESAAPCASEVHNCVTYFQRHVSR